MRGKSYVIVRIEYIKIGGGVSVELVYRAKEIEGRYRRVISRRTKS